jgi:hypothetical protein
MNEDSRKHNKDNVDDTKHVPGPSFLSVVKENINANPMTISEESEVDLLSQYTADAAYLASLITFGGIQIKAIC